MDHDGRAEAGLVGENTALAALGNDLRDGDARCTACHSLDTKCKAENRCENSACLLEVHDEYGQGADDIKNSHEGNDPLCNCSNALQTADDDQTAEDHQGNTDDQVDDGDSGNGAERDILKERSLQIQGDLVDLTHVADAEGCQNGKDCEKRCQNGTEGLAVLIAAQTVLQIVHGAAGPFAVCIAAAEVDAQNIFGEIGHHTEKGSDPHPEHGTGTADDDGSGNTRDIAGTDGGGKGSAERLKLGNGLFIGLFGSITVADKKRADGHFPPVTHMGYLKELGAAGQQNAGADQQKQTDLNPNKVVDDTVDTCQFFKKSFHNKPPE